MECCKLCFEEIEICGFNAIRKGACICQNCYNKFNVVWKKEYIDKVETLIVYEYDDYLKKLFFQFKGCYDYDLKDVFLFRHLFELKLLYKDYLIVPIPSSESSNKKRGYNHVVEIFKSLNLPIYRCIKKKEDFKQSELNKKEREKIINKLVVRNCEKIKDKKILIVDDIITTGSSLKACINLVSKYKPKLLKSLIICKKMSK